MAKPVRIVIVGDAAGLTRTLDRSNAELTTFGRKAEAVGARMKRTGAAVAAAGGKLSKGVSLPLVALAVGAGKLAVDFESKTNLLVTAAGDTRKNMETISEGILGIARQTGESTSGLAEGAYVIDKSLGTMGKSSKRATVALETLRAAAQGATAEGVDMSTMTQGLTTLLTSYGDKLGGPIQATNALVRAAGLSKTNMNEFVGSLSNVMPLAASLGISFNDVAGTMATMTQHGETAQHATDVLANLITNLAGQNNVAASAMQSLGIDTVDLQRNLGKRGLSGTLAIVDKAMKEHTKDGMVVVDVHKAAALATKSLHQEIGSMSGGLADQSKALLSGNTNISAYTKYAKGLGGTAGASALQFLALYKSSQGFSDQLKAGNGTIKTSAATLQKALGGVTGMRAALQTTGEYAALTSANIKSIGEASKGSGKDIETWADTQKTTKVQLGQLEQQVKTAGITLGQGLIPAVKDAILQAQPFLKTIAGWAKSFHDASPATQGMIVKLGLIAVAAGPVLSIVGKLTSAIGSFVRMGAKIASFATQAAQSLIRFIGTGEFTAAAVEAQQARQALANQLAAAAVKVAEAEKAQATAQASVEIAAALEGTDSALAAEATVAAEAAIEFAAAMQAEADAAVRAAATVAASSEAGATAAAAGAEATAASSVAAGEAASVGFGPVGLAVAGVVGVGALAAHALGLFGKSASEQIKPTQDLTNAILEDNNALGTHTEKLIVDRLQSSGAYDAAVKLGISQRTLTLAMEGNAEAQAEVNGKTLSASIANMAAVGSHKKLTKAQHDSIDAAAKLSKTTGDLSKVLDVNKHAADNEAKGLGTYGKNSAAAAKATRTAAAALDVKNRVAALSVNLLTVLGGLKVDPKISADPTQAKKTIVDLTAEINAIRQSKNPQLNADSKPGAAAVKHLQDLINGLQGKSVDISAHVTTEGVGGSFAAPKKTKPHAAGGTVDDGFFTVGEQGYELGYKQGNKVRIWSNSQSKKITGMSKVPGFAGGTGSPMPPVTTKTVGKGKKATTHYLFNGKEYASEQALHNAEDAWRKSHTSKLGRVGTDLGKINGGLTAERLKSTVDKLAGDAKTAGLGKDVLKFIGDENKLLARQVKLRDQANDRLKTARDHYAGIVASFKQMSSGIASKVTDSFNLTDSIASKTGTAGAYVASGPGGKLTYRAGSQGGILATLKTKVAAAKAFAAGLKKLLAAGVAPSLVQQVAEAGPEDGMPAVTELLSYSKTQVSDLNSNASQLAAFGKQAGDTVAHATYDSALATGRALISGFDPKNKQMAASVKKLADSLYGAGKYSVRALSKGMLAEAKTARQVLDSTIGDLTGRVDKALGIKKPKRAPVTKAPRKSKKAKKPKKANRSSNGAPAMRGAVRDLHFHITSPRASSKQIAADVSFALKTSGG